MVYLDPLWEGLPLRCAEVTQMGFFFFVLVWQSYLSVWNFVFFLLQLYEAFDLFLIN